MKLAREDLPLDPLALFDRWFEDAKATDREPDAMTIATLGDNIMPDLRTVLLRDMVRERGREGVVFYTNYLSAKGRALEENPACAALFYWGDLAGKSRFGGRQVRIRGFAERAPEAMSDAYFTRRPRLSQLGAWASAQSEVIDDGVLDVLVERIAQRFEGQPVTRPPHWGGYLVVIRSIEFWQSRSGRLHDRFRYNRDGTGWRIERLAP